MTSLKNYNCTNFFYDPSESDWWNFCSVKNVAFCPIENAWAAGNVNLFNNKHLMVEKLLKFFIGQINAQLLIRVFLENKMLKYVCQTCLFKNKHCVVEQLLELLVCVINAQLLKVIHL